MAITLLIFASLALSHSNMYADVPYQVLFDKYNSLETGKLDAGRLVDAIMNNEIDVHDSKTIEFLENRTRHDLQIIRNTFFAKHGLIFKTSELQNYFGNKPWYHPRQSLVVLPVKEEKIVSVIQKIENCDNVRFDEFRKLFTPLTLPISYNDDLQRKTIRTIYIRKFLAEKADYLPYNAIAELYSNKFIVLLYEMSSFETQPGIAIFSLDGKLISDKTFYSIGGDITGSTTGQLIINNDLTIYVDIHEYSNDSRDNEVEKTKSEKYRIDIDGNIKQIK